ncbi:gap protein [Mycobacterium sp. IS-2888]|uniref:GAP family protein n=1 Tax=unclassified Mycobacterium TaxID=2642494 RepID=UPI00096E99E6|nr:MULTISPECIES: GAP family protein [unclassified Mycobacterium]OMC46077.1 gap protein [Mycobacterium sp. IS-1264]OMC50571.1 gap protein [Mycobacterium sp. IS-2888]
MWSSLLGFAIFVTLHPLRLGIILLVISRPRPVQNLFAYWLGCIAVNVPSYLVPLIVLHVTPTFASFTRDLAKPGTGANSAAHYIQIGLGVLALSIAAVMAVRFSARQREKVPAAAGSGSTLVLESNTPKSISRLIGQAQDPPTEGESIFRRLLRRGHDVWQNGSLWVAFLIGVLMAPSLEGVLIVDAIIVASGAAIGTQISAAIAFVVGMLAVEEIILVSYLVAPAKTQAAVRVLRDWAWTHRRKIVLVIIAVVGVSLVAQGMAGT